MKSLRMGDEANSGLSNTQLDPVSPTPKAINGTINAYLRKCSKPVFLCSRNFGRKREMWLFRGSLGIMASA